MYKIGCPPCAAFKLGKYHSPPKHWSHGHRRLPGPKKLRAHVSVFIPRHSSHVVICCRLQQKQKPSRNGARSQGSPEPNTNEELLAIDGELTTRSERLWCVRRAGTSGGAAATLSSTAPPVIFRQDAPHHTAPASLSALFITRMPSFAEQARPCPSLSYLLSNICRLVFLLPPGTHRISLKEEFGVTSQRHVNHPLQALAETFAVLPSDLLLYPPRKRGQER